MTPSSRKRPLFIFCGGESRRTGRDKALLTFGDETFLEHLVRRASETCSFSEIALLSNGRRYHPGLQAHADALPGSGPLGGMLAAMTVAMGPVFATLTVDSPSISARLFKTLATLNLSPGVDAAIVCSPSSIYPLSGVFQTHLRGPLKNRLLEKNYRVLDFIDSIRTESIPCSEEEIRNINTPEDYRKFLTGTGSRLHGG